MTEAVALLDANVLVALALEDHVHHDRATQLVPALRGGIATCGLTEAALVRLVLNPVVAGQRVHLDQALAFLESVRRQPHWRYLADDQPVWPGPSVDLTPLVGDRQVTDFHLIALAAHHGARLATFDGSLPRALAPGDRSHVLVLR